MKFLYLLLASFLLIPSFLQAQIEQISYGPGYANQIFYDLKTDSATSYDHVIWDIAFSVSGQGASVFINEAAASTAPAQVELYLSTASDFASIDTAGMMRIYNPEISWDDGAFNSVKEETDPFDFGWGAYNTTSHTLNASRFFVIRLRDSVYKKFEVQSLVSGVYTFHFSDLDGGNELTKTLDKSNYPGKSLAYYSFAQDSTLDLEPDAWDLKFTRYHTPLDDGNGGTLEYMVTGVISNIGVEVAQANGIDTATVSYMDYDTAYSSVLTTIGHDWKSFDLGTFSWTIPSDRVYYLKNSQNELWKIQFIDFEGSSTGIATFKRTFETEITSVEEFESLVSYNVYPNPSSGRVNIAFELDRPATQAQVLLTNPLGQVVLTQNVRIQQGLNVNTLDINLPAGLYYVALEVGKDRITQKLLVK